MENKVVCDDVRNVLPTIRDANLIIADPPYGNVLSDSWDKIKDYKGFTDSWMSLILKALHNTGSVYVWCSLGPKSSSNVWMKINNDTTEGMVLLTYLSKERLWNMNDDIESDDLGHILSITRYVK